VQRRAPCYGRQPLGCEIPSRRLTPGSQPGRGLLQPDPPERTEWRFQKRSSARSPAPPMLTRAPLLKYDVHRVPAGLEPPLRGLPAL
jgi:hypothetical protein